MNKRYCCSDAKSVVKWSVEFVLARIEIFLYFCTGAPGPTRARRSCRSHPTRMGVHVWEVGPCDAGVLLRSRPRVTYEKVDLHGSPVKINIVKENCCEPATRAAGGRHSIHDICDTSGCVSHIVIKRERQIFCLSEHYFCPWLRPLAHCARSLHAHHVGETIAMSSV